MIGNGYIALMKFIFFTDYMNALILASNILEARENFKKNRRYLEDMIVYLFKQGKEKDNGGL